MDQGVIDYIANVFDIPKLAQPVSAVQMPLPLTRLAEIPLDSSVNQCQGFCYNSKKDVFVLACINADNTKQIIYEINPTTLQVTAKYEYSQKRLLGHMNTLTYNPNNNRYYTTNAAVSYTHLDVYKRQILYIIFYDMSGLLHKDIQKLDISHVFIVYLKEFLWMNG